VKVSLKAKLVRNTETELQVFGPRGSQTGPVRSPVIMAGLDDDTEQSAPM